MGVQRDSRRITTTLTPTIKVLELNQNIDLSLLEGLTFSSIMEQGYALALSVFLLRRVVASFDESQRRNILSNLTKNRHLIRPAGDYQTTDGVILDEAVKYYKYLKGMLVFLKIHTYFNQPSSVQQIENGEQTDMYEFSPAKICRELNRKFQMNIDPDRTIQLVCNPSINSRVSRNGKINIDKRSYEDLLYFYYLWYVLPKPQDKFRLDKLVDGFTYNYSTLREAIDKYLGIFEIYLSDINTVPYYGVKNARRNVKMIEFIPDFDIQTELQTNRRRGVIL